MKPVLAQSALQPVAGLCLAALGREDVKRKCSSLAVGWADRV